MKTGRGRLSVVQVNCAFDKSLNDPEALLDRYTTLTGWAEALLDAGAVRSAVVQRFPREVRIARNGVDYLFVANGIADAAAALSPDIVHVNGLMFGFTTWRIRQRVGTSAAIVVQNHSDTGPMGRAPLQRLTGIATRHAVDGFLFAAEDHVERWRRAGFVGPRHRTYVVMEASSRFEPLTRDAARAASGIGGAPAILWVGRLNANKDPLTILDAFERTAAELPAATLTMIYSADDLIGAVRARIERSAALRARVRLAGAVVHDGMPECYSAADLFVLGSHHEGSGYALIEALACGVTPVVTDIPSFRLLTDDGAIGVLWPPGDPAACARAVIEAAQRDLGAERRRVRDHFARHFSWSAIGRRAMQIYENVLEPRH